VYRTLILKSSQDGKLEFVHTKLPGVIQNGIVDKVSNIQNVKTRASPYKVTRHYSKRNVYQVVHTKLLDVIKTRYKTVER